MTCPLRFVVCTYNLWKAYRWPERQEPLRQFLQDHRPDILCIQEFCPDTRDVLDQVLDTHQRVEDSFAGWVHEGNIYWNREIFSLIAYGAEEIGIVEPLRRLFWVRLRPCLADGPELLVTTAHYTWPGNAIEKANMINVRIAQAANTIEALNRLAEPSTPLLFMGDLNDHYHPIKVLQEGGLIDSFTGLGRIPQITRPALPTSRHTPEVVDWVLHRGPLRPMSSEVVDFYIGDIAPSDHKPILVTYRLA